MDELPKSWLLEFGHDTPEVWMFGKFLNPLEQLMHRTMADLRYALLGVPTPYVLEIPERRFGEADDRVRHTVTSDRAETLPPRASLRGPTPDPQVQPRRRA